jgi:uncharacterized protein with PQ loop repeat
MDNQVIVIPYTATSLSLIARIIFMYLLYTKKSTNNYSLIFCILNIISSSMWIYYSYDKEDIPMIVRSSIDVSLLTLSSIYIIRNKLISITVSITPGQ